VKEAATIKEGQEFSHNILEVFAAKRKRDDKKGKASELSATSTEPQACPAVKVSTGLDSTTCTKR